MNHEKDARKSRSAEEARTVLDEGITTAAANGDRYYESELYRLKGVSYLPGHGHSVQRQSMMIRDDAAMDEAERLIRHAREVRQTLISGLRCGCENLHECIDCVLKQCA